MASLLSEVELSPDAQREIERLRARLADEIAAKARLQRSLDQMDVPLQHVGDSVRFLSDAFEELAQLFQGYREALMSLRSTHTPAAAQLAELRELETACDFEFLAREVPKICARSCVEAEQVAGLVRAMKTYTHDD